jgi:hypothetical protein
MFPSTPNRIENLCNTSYDFLINLATISLKKVAIMARLSGEI